MKYCTLCGTGLPPDSYLCKYCGHMNTPRRASPTAALSSHDAQPASGSDRSHADQAGTEKKHADLDRSVRYAIEQAGEERRLITGLMLETKAAEAQAPATNVATLEGTPQVNGVPPVHGSPSTSLAQEIAEPARGTNGSTAQPQSQIQSDLSSNPRTLLSRHLQERQKVPAAQWVIITIAAVGIVFGMIVGFIVLNMPSRPRTILNHQGSTANQPRLSITPASLDFGKLQKGKMATQTLTVSDSGKQALVWTAETSTATWLIIDTTTGIIQPGAFQTIQVTADSSSLRPGSYATTLTIHAGSESRQVEVTLVVTAVPKPTPTPTPVTPTPVSTKAVPEPTLQPTPHPAPALHPKSRPRTHPRPKLTPTPTPSIQRCFILCSTDVG